MFSEGSLDIEKKGDIRVYFFPKTYPEICLECAKKTRVTLSQESSLRNISPIPYIAAELLFPNLGDSI